MKKLNIIMNERIYKDHYSFYSENVDCKSIVEGLNEKFDIKLFARKTNVKKKNKVLFFNICLSNNILFFLFNIFCSLKDRKNSIFLIISITPYTFFSYLILFFFTDKIFLYLRSDGFKEYSSILGNKWVFLYSLMFYVMTQKTNIIACTKSLSRGKKFYYVKPSEIDKDWFFNRKIKKNLKIKILYIGRIKIEKGIFNLIKLINQINDNNIKLSIVGDQSKSVEIFDKKIKFFDYVYDKKKLIKLYDNHDILILPSYTEAHPKVIDEALSRLKPVIVFEDIKHVVNNRKGVFCIKREFIKLKGTIYFIVNNYNKVCNNIKKNKLPTKKQFLDDFYKVISEN